MAPLLALDTGSAIVSVAVGERDRFDVLSAPQGRSSRELIAMIDELLTGAGIKPRDLSGIGAARGPGSFTGLRVGLATALGLHQASGVRAGAVSTFEILAAHYFKRTDNGATEVVAVIDALRERWYTQPMRLAENGRVEAAGPPEIRARADLVRAPLAARRARCLPASRPGRSDRAVRTRADPAASHGGRRPRLGWRNVDRAALPSLAGHQPATGC